MNYQVVLFKNKEKKRIIKKFITKERAKIFYDKLIKESDDVIFESRTENGHPCKFELALVKYGEKINDKIYIKDELGRTIKVETDNSDYSILYVKDYRIEEEFWDYSKKKKIDSNQFIKKYLGTSGLKQISKLNNKIIVQNDEKLNLFTLKTDDDASRFVETLTDKFNSEKRKDCLIISDYSTAHRKYMYSLLVEHGFSIVYLRRQLTTHPLKK
jgi:hypothetical protein